MVCPSQDMKLVVKHTFLEFVDSETKAPAARGRPRVFTDSIFYSNSSSHTTTPPDHSELALSDISEDNDIPTVRVVNCSELDGLAEKRFREARSPSWSPWTAPKASPTLSPQISPLPPLTLSSSLGRDEDSDGKDEDDFEQLPQMTSSWTSPCGWWWMPLSAVSSSTAGPDMTRCPSTPVTSMEYSSQYAASPANRCANDLLDGMPYSAPYVPKAPLAGPPGCFTVRASRPVGKQDANESKKLEERMHFDKLLGGAFFPSAARTTSSSTEALRTTVMIRNLPVGYTRSLLLDLLNSEGFGGKYDFVYLPIDFNSGASLGYAFVDLLSPDCAQDFFYHFDGFSVHRRSKAEDAQGCCTVTWSDPHQGLTQHVERYRSSPVMHAIVPDEWKPIIFVDGVPVAFPPPTKRIKAPKIRERNNCGHSHTRC